MENNTLRKDYLRKRNKKLKLSLIVPCYNEENNVRPFFDACKAAFSGKIDSFEAIFVNDGSKDCTGVRLSELFSVEDNVSVIGFSRNFGKEAAMLAGLEKAAGDYITIIDADLQQSPETVLKMVEILDTKPEYQCVAAYQEKRREGFFKTVCKGMFYKIINKMSDIELHPAASDFRTVRRCVADAVLSLGEYHRFSKGIFSWVGFETYYIPYVASQRNSGKSSWSFRKLLGYSVDGITNYSVLPLRLPLYFGVLSIIGAVIGLLVKLFSGTLTSLTPGVLLLVILLLWGVSCIFTGVMGLYLSKDYTENKHRPKYIIKEYLRHDDEK